MNLLMSRRTTIAACVVALACVFYGAYSFLILERIDHWASRLGPIDPTAPLDEDVERVLCLLEAALIGSLFPLFFTACAIHLAMRHRYRERHDLCAQCGRKVADWHGRCPGCGARLGPDPPRVHTIVAHCR